MTIKISARYCIAFFSLTILCGTSHEFAHHFVGAAICGCFGYKTFNSFQLCAGCADVHSMYYWATLAGPIFTFALMWFGWYQIKYAGEKQKALGFALIFGNFPINRIVFAWMNMNDEQYAARLLFGDSGAAYWIVNALILLVTVPPLVASYRLIENRYKLGWFLIFLIVPFLFVILFAGFLEVYLLLEWKVLAETIWGIPRLVLAAEFVAFLLYFLFKKHLYASFASGD